MTKKQRETFAEFEEQEQRQQNAAIADKVMDHLGQPGNLQSVQVNRLWQHHYRVNVYIGDGMASATVANSFFLVTDGNGDIITSTPAISRVY